MSAPGFAWARIVREEAHVYQIDIAPDAPRKEFAESFIREALERKIGSGAVEICGINRLQDADALGYPFANFELRAVVVRPEQWEFLTNLAATVRWCSLARRGKAPEGVFPPMGEHLRGSDATIWDVRVLEHSCIADIISLLTAGEVGAVQPERDGAIP